MEWRPPPTLPYHLVEAIEKGAFGSPSTSVGQIEIDAEPNSLGVIGIGLIIHRESDLNLKFNYIALHILLFTENYNALASIYDCAIHFRDHKVEKSVKFIN